MLKIARYYACSCVLLLVGMGAISLPSQAMSSLPPPPNRPASIVVLPPINHSVDTQATYGLLSTVTFPLAEAGYYVFPVALVDQTFKENGLDQPDEMHNAPLDKIRDIFGADAALYITIEQYGAKYKVIKSEIVVKAKAQLRDTRTGELLWEGSASASNNEGGGETATQSLFGTLLGAIVDQVLDNVGDSSHEVARTTSWRLLRGPKGLQPGPRFVIPPPAQH